MESVYQVSHDDGKGGKAVYIQARACHDGAGPGIKGLEASATRDVWRIRPRACVTRQDGRTATVWWGRGKENNKELWVCRSSDSVTDSDVGCSRAVGGTSPLARSPATGSVEETPVYLRPLQKRPLRAGRQQRFLLPRLSGGSPGPMADTRPRGLVIPLRAAAAIPGEAR